MCADEAQRKLKDILWSYTWSAAKLDLSQCYTDAEPFIPFLNGTMVKATIIARSWQLCNIFLRYWTGTLHSFLHPICFADVWPVWRTGTTDSSHPDTLLVQWTESSQRAGRIMKPFSSSVCPFDVITEPKRKPHLPASGQVISTHHCWSQLFRLSRVCQAYCKSTVGFVSQRSNINSWVWVPWNHSFTLQMEALKLSHDLSITL